MDSRRSVYKWEGETEGAATSTACSVTYSNKQFTMELESKDRKQRNYNTFLTVFVAVTFTVALLQGVGLVIFYSHFQAANNALEARITAFEAGEPAVPASSNTGEPTGTIAEYPFMLPLCSHSQYLHCLTFSVLSNSHYTYSHYFHSPSPTPPASETVKRSANNYRYPSGSQRYPTRDCKCPAGPPGPPGPPGEYG